MEFAAGSVAGAFLLTTLAGAAELLRLAEQTKKGASHEST